MAQVKKNPRVQMAVRLVGRWLEDVPGHRTQSRREGPGASLCKPGVHAGSQNAVCDAAMLDMCYYTSVQTHSTHKKCQLWARGEYVSM